VVGSPASAQEFALLDDAESFEEELDQVRP
jgi:hypothetical protein